MLDINLNLRFYFDHSLINSSILNQFQKFLVKQAPRWTKNLHIWRTDKDKRYINLNNKNSLKENMLIVSFQHGPTFKWLESQFGSVPKHIHGSAELRGSYSDIEVIVSIDELNYRKIGGKLLWLNCISVGIYGSKIEQLNYVKWARNFFESFCKEFGPIYSYAATDKEYSAKNMNKKDGVVKAVGVDFQKYLPGIYWLNFYGNEYCQIFNQEKLLAVSANRVAKVGEGVLLELSESPDTWNSEEYKNTEREIRVNLGSNHFFLKE